MVYGWCWDMLSETANATTAVGENGETVTQEDVVTGRAHYELKVPDEPLYYESIYNLIERDLHYVLYCDNWFDWKDGRMYFFPEGRDVFLQNYGANVLGKEHLNFHLNQTKRFLYSNPEYLEKLFRFIPTSIELRLLLVLDLYIQHLEFIFVFNILFLIYSIYIILAFKPYYAPSDPPTFDKKRQT